MSDFPEDMPRLPRRPDACTDAEWTGWQRRLTEYVERQAGRPLKFKSVSRAGW